MALPAAGGIWVPLAGAVLDADRGDNPDYRQDGKHGGENQGDSYLDSKRLHVNAPGWLEVHGIADQRAGHAVTATPAAAQFGADDRDDFDTSLAQQRVCAGVAVIGEDHAG